MGWGGTAIFVLTHCSPIHSGDTYIEVTALNEVRTRNHYTALHCCIWAFWYSEVYWWLNLNCHSCTIEKKCHIQCNESTVCDLLCCETTTLLDSRSLSFIVTSATAGSMVTRGSVSPGRVVRSRKKFSLSSRIMSLVISTEKHCRRVVFENGPTPWLMIGVKSLLPGGSKNRYKLASFPGSPTLDCEQWSYASRESLVVFLMWAAWRVEV